MAGLEQLVPKNLNPEAPEFVPHRNQNTKLINLPSITSSNNNTHYHYYCSQPPPPVLTFQNPSYNFHDYTPPSQYTYTTTFVPHHPSLYTNSPSYPSQPLADPKVVGKKVSCSRRGKRGCSSNRSLWRKYGGRSRPAGFQGCDVSNDKKQHCCCRRSSVVLSNNARKQLPNKQQHPVVPVHEDGESTTVMIRNIPNRFTREMLMGFLDDHCLVENQKAKQLQNDDRAAAEVEPISAFDFLYLPMDFKTGVNKGYAFVNFTNSKAAWKFYLSAHNLPWGVFQTNKIRQVALARLQGKEELEKHFQSSNFPCEGKYEYLPVCFSPARDGSREMVNQRTVGRCTAAHHHAKSSAGV